MTTTTQSIDCSETVKILSTLIGFNTVSRNSNLELIHWVEDYLAKFGIKSHLVYNAAGDKANLFATIGEGVSGGIVLSGHTDVVPTEGQPWTCDPFQATIKDGKLYGRGACDMKGFLAAVLATVPLMTSRPLKRPVHLSFTYDEEVGCQGVRTLIADLEQRGIRPAHCIVGEPTHMWVVRAHKGSRNYSCCVRGKAAHASMPHLGVNAIEYASRIVSHIQDISEDFQTNAVADADYSYPHNAIQVSLISGGTVRNTVPANCELTFGYRYIPACDPDQIFRRIADYAETQVMPKLQAKGVSNGIEFKTLSDNPGLSDATNAALANHLASLDGTRGVGAGVSYMTEGGLFQRAGMEVVICGPGSIDQAHKPDEFVELEQLELCQRFLSHLCAVEASDM